MKPPEDRVKAVKEIHEKFKEDWDTLADTLPDCSSRLEYEYNKLEQEFYKQICQLFERPKIKLPENPYKETDRAFSKYLGWYQAIQQVKELNKEVEG